MESENESRPLLHSFERETWRNRMRRNCWRIPSEVTITGAILGLFLIVVTLLIVLQNLERTETDELKLGNDNKVLASPIKYNKKILDSKWQEKKDSMKPRRKTKFQKWHRWDKGWETSESPGQDDVGERTDYPVNPDEFIENTEFPDEIDEYGKEIDNSFEPLLSQTWNAKDSTNDEIKNEVEVRTLLRNSKIEWEKIDDGWKKLIEQGWKDKNIKTALIQAILDGKEAQKNNSNMSESVNISDFWEKLNDSWKKNMKKGNKQPEKQEKINDDWKKKFQSSNIPESNYKWKKIDNGWKTLSNQGWTDRDIRKALSNAIQEKTSSLDEKIQILQSPMSLEDMMDKIERKVKKNQNKGGKSENTSNDKTGSEINVLQSPKAVANKWKKSDEGWMKLLDQGWKNKEIKEALINALLEEKAFLNKQNEILQSPMKIEDIWDEINGLWSKHMKKGDLEQEKQEKTNDDWANKAQVLKSPNSKADKWKKVNEGWKRISYQGDEEKDTQKTINNDWRNNMHLLMSPNPKADKWKKVNEGWKKNSYQGWKDQDYKQALDEAWKKRQILLQSPINIQGIWGKTADMLKNLIKKGSNIENYEESDDGEEMDGTFETSRKSHWTKENDTWNTLLEQGWNNNGIKQALINALKDEIFEFPRAFENFLNDMIEIIKELQKRENANNETTENPSEFDSMESSESDSRRKELHHSVEIPRRCPIRSMKSQSFDSSYMAPPVDCALIAEEVRKDLGECIDISFLPKECKPSWRTKCFTLYKYRKIDATCNNKIHPTWGQSGTPFVRMVAADYADGVSALRTATDGSLLPNARYLSNKLYSKRMKSSSSVSVLFLYFGLIVDHDMVETSVNSDAIPCCKEEFQKRPQNRPRECLQIDVSKDDPFYGPRNVTCLNLVRSVPVNGECAGRREQLNKATSYLDGSSVYGSVMKQAKQLRSFSRGQLRTQMINNTPFMSANEGAGFSCGTREEPLKCFEAGDSRVNMMVELTAMHTVWYREHNRIATELHKINPHWTDEVLYQEARRILIGELQKITYSEFLPLLLGKKAMTQYGLKLEDSKEYKGYDNTVNPSVFNVFGVAAFRFGHSLVPSMQQLSSLNNSSIAKVPLHETFFNSEILYHKGLDLLLRGAATQRAQTVDSYITPEVREHLFQPAGRDYGHDLAAVGIQRGRDHGLPSYTKWRSVCGLSEVKHWNDLYKIMDKERADMFKNVYKSVEDIDLIPAALAEQHEEGSMLGPTYVCLIGRQFKKTRIGDRFWFEIQNEVGSFTKDQLGEIYRSNMARIICDNSDNIKKIQRNPFQVPSDHNVVLDCESFPKVDLSKWSGRK